MMVGLEVHHRQLEMLHCPSTYQLLGRGENEMTFIGVINGSIGVREIGMSLFDKNDMFL